MSVITFTTIALCVAVPAASAQEAVLDDRQRFEARLRSTPVLSELQFHVVEVPPFALYVERFLGEPPDHAERTRALFGGHLSALYDELANTVLTGIPDAPTRAQLFVPIVLLASAGSYQDFSRSRPNDLRDFGGGEYRHSLRAAIGYQDLKGKRRPVEDQLRPVLRDACLALLAAHSPGEGFPRTHWLLSGLSWVAPERVLSKLRPTPSAAATTAPTLPIEKYFFDQTYTILSTPAQRTMWWMPLAPIVDLDGRTRFFDWPGIAAAGRGWPAMDAPHVAGAYAMFRTQSALLVAYLSQGADSTMQAKFRVAAARGFAGGLRAEALAGALGLESLAQLESPLIAWLNGIFAARGQAAVPLESSSAPTIATDIATSTETGKAHAHASGSAPAAAFDPASLAPAPDSDEHRIAEALWLARSGNERAALTRLGAALELASTDDLRARIDRERARVAALSAAREAWLARVLAGDRCRLPVAGELRNVEVTALEDGALRLTRPVGGVATVPLEALDAAVLALNLARKEFSALAPPWAVGYALLIAGDDGWRRALRGAEGASDVQADVDSILALVPIGRGYGLLAALAAGGVPTTVNDAQSVLERIAELRSDDAGRALMTARSDAVRQLALGALEVQLAAQGFAALLQGKAVQLDGGHIRVEYPFDSERELQDFTRPTSVPGLPAKLDAATTVVTKVDAGELRLQGRVELRHVLALNPPCRLRIELVEPEFSEGSDDWKRYTTIFSLLDDGAWTKAASCWNREYLEVRSGSFHFSKSAGAGHFVHGSDCTIELRVLAEGRVELQIDGNPSVTCRCDTLGQGWTRIMTEAPAPLRVQRIELEGAPTQSSVDALVRTHAQLRLAELGL
jgi:hypothetical protein